MSTHVECVNCAGWINTESTAYDKIRVDDKTVVYSHHYHCSRQYFTYGVGAGHVVETVHPRVKELK